MVSFRRLLRRHREGVSPDSLLTRTVARLVRPGARYYLLASAPFVVAFGIIPFSLHAHSGEEWAFALELLLRLASLGLLALAATLAVLRLIAVASTKTIQALALALFCLGVFALLAHVYAPVAIAPLDGGETTSAEPLSYTLLEGGLLVGATLLFLALWRSRGLAIAGSFAVTLWLVGIGYLLAILWWSNDDRAEASLVESGSLSSSGSCGVESNVYHIVLDALATDAFLKVIDREDWTGEFEGFDLFYNNISNYMMTVNSMASYLTGKFYYTGDLREWRQGSAEGLFRHLDANGFRLWMYAPLEEWKPRYPYVDVFRSNVAVYSERIGAPQGEFYEFLSVWLMSLTPNVLTNEVIPVTANAADGLFALLTSSRWSAKEDLEDHGSDRRARLLKTGFHAFAATLLLEKVALDEPARQPSCQYVYAHAMLPHDPFVIDGQCRYVGPWNRRTHKVSTRQAYLQQVECAVRKVIDFLHLLKSMNRYDAATIVLHGDHGAPTLRFRTSADRSGAEVLGRPRAGMLARVQALLMIKRPHAQHRVEVVETPTQLVDIYPTIFDVLGLELKPGEVHGRSVYASAAAPREARFALDPERRYGPNLVEVRIDDPVDLVTSNLTVIGPPTEPAVWREEVRRAAASGASAEVSGRR
jgi:hypothetical protein